MMVIQHSVERKALFGEKLNFKFLKFMILLINSFGTTVTFYFSFENSSNGTFFMWLIPLFYTVLFYKTNMLYGALNFFGIAIFNAILFFRYLISPAYSSLYGIYDHSRAGLISEFANRESILLMLYEMICFFIVFHFSIKKLIKYKNIMSQEIYFKNLKVRGLIVVMMIGVISFLIFPAIRERTNFLIASGFGESNLSAIAGIGFLFTEASLQCLFLLVVINQFKNLIIGQKVKDLLIIFIIILQVSIFWSESRTTVVVNGIASIGLLLYLKLLNKTIFVSIVSVTIIATLSLSAFQMFKDGDLVAFRSSISEYSDQQTSVDYLQSYFGGQNLIANAIELKPKIQNRINIETFFNEIIGSILFIRQVFPPSNNQTTVHFNKIFGHDEMNSMILPTLGQGYLYFGLIGAPIISVLFSVLLIKAEKSLLLSNTIGEKYAFLVLVIWLGLFPLQNMNIIAATIFNVFGPLYLFVKFNKVF
ncbi:hypothetical protein [Cecembia lonarensis]|uniref:Uncharacterized protein n=1 Tax=Cecembia lonarensis (strain CCUG 58316 / KCTC 22772 / LW9) TaxID=1225176 RepID=K1L1H1_CECL9|nr:hypothetical protein [Cecembia lonarensis]EKB48606.1 hypothetical protein B879_02764 [Cecembia lonarensis LW9]